MRKGTVAAILNNIALLNQLFLENPEQDQIATIRKAVVNLMPSLKAIGVFDLFNPIEWLNNPKQLGRMYVAILYLKNYPDEISNEILSKLQETKQTVQNFFFSLHFKIFVTKKNSYN